MDLIYMNHQKEDVGVMLDYSLDLAFGESENNFECKVMKKNHCCEAGYFLYYESAEYGGIIDSVRVDTDQEEITYKGRTWHGILESKIIEPDGDYLILSGEANAVIGTLIDRLGVSDLFEACSDESGITISSYKMNRYIAGYSGIMKMLKSADAKLAMTFEGGKVCLSAIPLVDYSKKDEFDADQFSFVIQKNSHPINHVICLGKGNLSEREVIHLYADADGNISHTQSLTGIDEVVAVYDYSSVESTEELEEGGRNIIKESHKSDEINFDFNTNDTTYDVGDIVGACEYTTGIAVQAEITKKIVAIRNNKTTISYKVG